MSKTYKNLFLLFFTLCCFTVFANENSKLKISEDGSRIYLDPAQVVVNQNGIFFFADGQYYPTQMLVHDEQGLSIYAAPMYWTCKRGHVNPLYVYPCRICGLGAPGD